ncbi:MAG: 4'-phosphopantetheinyl transferase superfamily protein [Planctomycetes bacterium]|nr:4'-phosphopantetheinyl transferase superfamily protein [Planctomycetota bacterium]MCB9918942.1 4'-phosphopantetheinyl transferase superfamily protein [Planctomycetota bacterium]
MTCGDGRQIEGILPPSCAVFMAPLAVPGSRAAARTAGRTLAANALDELGHDEPGIEIPTGERGAPVWPAGFTGSISHTKKRVIVAIGRLTDHASIGIDIEEQSRNVSMKILPRIATPRERAWIEHGIDDALRAPRERLLAVFSSKEAIFKALWPLWRRELGFHDAILVRTADGFEASLNPGIARSMTPVIPRLEIQVTHADGAIVSAIHVPRVDQIP